ncbi:glutaredoxin family protein [Oxynema sp. CENA135]|uniref:glutaredoxin family protein n=1 Tax=Oxynema sp. CENA135 TaxID=984206 RepID=UPI00351CAEAA
MRHRSWQNWQNWQNILLGVLAFVAVFLTPLYSFAQTENGVLDVYFFYSYTCPHCAEQKPLMHEMDRSDRVTVHFHEVTEEPQLWQQFRAKYGVFSGAVPRTFIGERSFIGYVNGEGALEYNEAYQGYIGYRNQIIRAVEEEIGASLSLSSDRETPNLAQNVKKNLAWFLLPILYVSSYPFTRNKLKTEQHQRYWMGGAFAFTIVSLFAFIASTPDIVIKEFASQLPFPLFVSAIALADGFNPCAFTVLIILLSLLTYTKSRRDMSIVGGTFITTSAVMYFLFIMLMVLVGSVFLEKYGTIFLWILGAFIAIAGLINIKDYFFFKQSVSLSLSEKQQLTITQKAGKIVRELKSAEGNKIRLLAAVGGTILLAIFVNIIELGCTAILPTVYMATLINVCGSNAWPCYSYWTAIYAAIYILPLLAILANFIYSFKSARLNENQGRILKLVGGTFMLFFGLLMLFKPEFLILA